jgi:hypothetical protein
MEEISLIDFLKIEIDCFRELLSSFIAEELAYKEAAFTRLPEICLLQSQILDELKTKRPKRFQPFNLQDDVDYSLLNNLKEQLDTLVHKVNSQCQRITYVKTLTPLTQEKVIKRQLKVDVCEDEC